MTCTFLIVFHHDEGRLYRGEALRHGAALPVVDPVGEGRRTGIDPGEE